MTTQSLILLCDELAEKEPETTIKEYLQLVKELEAIEQTSELRERRERDELKRKMHGQ